MSLSKCNRAKFLALFATLATSAAITFPAHAESKQCGDSSAATVVHHPARHARARRPAPADYDNLRGISQHYLQAAEEHLGRDEADVVKSTDFQLWAAKYDASAADHVCADKPATEANAHLLRGCLARYYDSQLFR